MSSPTFPNFDLSRDDLPGQRVFSSGEMDPGPMGRFDCENCGDTFPTSERVLGTLASEPMGRDVPLCRECNAQERADDLADHNERAAALAKKIGDRFRDQLRRSSSR